MVYANKAGIKIVIIQGFERQIKLDEVWIPGSKCL